MIVARTALPMIRSGSETTGADGRRVGSERTQDSSRKHRTPVGDDAHSLGLVGVVLDACRAAMSSPEPRSLQSGEHASPTAVSALFRHGEASTARVSRGSARPARSRSYAGGYSSHVEERGFIYSMIGAFQIAYHAAWRVVY
jgi:hypothetical protein